MDIPQFKDGRRNEKYGDESTLSERVFDVSKGSNLNPKEATASRPRGAFRLLGHATIREPFSSRERRFGEK